MFWDAVSIIAYLVSAVLLFRWLWDLGYPRVMRVRLDSIRMKMARDIALARAQKASILQVHPGEDGTWPLLVAPSSSVHIFDPATRSIMTMDGQTVAKDPGLERLHASVRIAQATRGVNAEAWANLGAPEAPALEMPWPSTPSLEQALRARTPSAENLLLGQLRDGSLVSRSIHTMMHTLVVGSTEQGKSTWLLSLLVQLALANAEVEVAAIDTHGSGLNALGCWSKLLCDIGRTTQDAKAIMADLVLGEITRRKQAYQTVKMATDLPSYNANTKGRKFMTRLVIIEEGTILMNQRGMERPLREAVQGGRQYGVYVIWLGQSARYDVVATQSRGQFRTRWVSWTEEESAKAALGMKPPGPLPTQKGRAWMLLDGGRRVELVQGLYVTRGAAIRAFEGHSQAAIPPVPNVQRVMDKHAQMRALNGQGLEPKEVMQVVYGYDNGDTYQEYKKALGLGECI